MQDIVDLLRKMKFDYTYHDQNTILRLAEVFKVPIDATRIDDFELVSVNLEMQSIKIFDRRNDISFVSMHLPLSHDKDILNFICLSVYMKNHIILKCDYISTEMEPFFTRIDIPYEKSKISVSKSRRIKVFGNEKSESLQLELYENFYDMRPKVKRIYTSENPPKDELLSEIFGANLNPEIIFDLVLLNRDLYVDLLSKGKKI